MKTSEADERWLKQARENEVREIYTRPENLCKRVKNIRVMQRK